MARRKDGLTEYRAKRDFGATPEPEGEITPAPADAPRFVVQEHRARALHWDLRLERDGVLASWAVPKGIPPDPRKNHLAVRTEDHPLEYLTFAGEIPDGQYGAGSMRVYDTGTYECHKFEPKEVMVTFHGDRVRGRYVLFHTRNDDWMIHRMDPPDDPDREPPPPNLMPMLATNATRHPSSGGWSWELKWDGVRAVGYVDGGRLTLFSRNGNEITSRYPELRALGAELGPRDAVLDGEIVAFDDDGKPSFERLQSRMHVANETAVRRLTREIPVVYVLFDLLWLDGHSLMDEPYEARRAALLDLGLTGAHWQTPPHEVGDGEATRAVSLQFGIEGVVAKRLDSIYEPGRRPGTWVKVKNVRRQEFVVGGYLEGEGNRSGAVGSLLVGYYDDNGVLHYAGRVGSGLSHADLEELARVTQAFALDTNPFGAGVLPKGARFLDPVLVVEVKFTEWTKAGVIRQPTFRGFRTDKIANEIVREEN